MKEPANDPGQVYPVGRDPAVAVVASRREVSGVSLTINGESGAELGPMSEKLAQLPSSDAPENLERHGSGRIKSEIKKFASFSFDRVRVDKGPPYSPGGGYRRGAWSFDALPYRPSGVRERVVSSVVRIAELVRSPPTLPPRVRPASDRHGMSFERRVMSAAGCVGNVENGIGAFAFGRR